MHSVSIRLVILAAFSLILTSNITSSLAGEAPPTNNREHTATALSFFDAKIAMGFPESLAKMPLVTGSDFKFGIVDSGFDGLEEWVQENPGVVSGQVVYKLLRKDGDRSKGTHGFHVFKTAIQVMPKAQFVLIETENHILQFKDILESMKSEGVFFATMSLGRKLNVAGYDPSKIYSALKLLEEYQITFLKSAGNYRDDSHNFPYIDADADGKLEFSTELRKNGRLPEYNPIGLHAGSTLVADMTWNEWPNRLGEYDLYLVDKENEILAQAKMSEKFPVLRLRYKAEKDGIYFLRLYDRNDNPPSKPVVFNLFVANNSNASDSYLNGRESLNIFSQYESPFLISVGGFGGAENGLVEPSYFSSIGHTNTGQIGPHVSGPGQLILDGETVRGTSYASPFIAAMYSVFADYNIKNVIEATTSHDRFIPGLVPEEVTRWGVPDAIKMLSQNECQKSNKVVNPAYHLDEENLILTFDFTRHCMEGLDYYLHAYLQGDQPINSLVSYPGQLLAAGSTYDLRGWAQYHSDTRNIEGQKVEIKIPLKHIPRAQFGRDLKALLKISTRAQWDPVRLGSPIKPIAITLPDAPEFGEEITGQVALNMIDAAAQSGAYRDLMELVRRSTISTELPESTMEKLRDIRAFAAAGSEDADA